MSERLRWLFSLASGLLLGLAFPPLPFPWLAWVAYVPLIAAIKECGDWRKSAVLASTAHLLAYAIAGHWVLLHSDAFTTVASAAGMVWLAATAAVPWILLSAKSSRSRLRSALWVIGSIGTLEMFQIHSELGFPWPALGNTQSEFEPFNQLAELAGVTGLSVWVLALNFSLSALLGTPTRARWGNAAIVSVLVLAPALSGLSRLDALVVEETPERGNFRILAIQPSLSLESWLDVASTSRVESLSTLTDEAIRNSPDPASSPDLIVWPETAIPPTKLDSSNSTRSLQSQVDRWGVPLLAGAIEITSSSGSRSPYRNAAFLIRPNLKTVQSYRKQRLVPFAEYVPYSARFPFLQRLAIPSGGVWGYTPGTSDGRFDIGPRQVGVLICFESSFGFLARRLALSGVTSIIIITQDGWWGKSSGYRQHLAFNRLRAIETRLPLIQVSATGISALITQSGRIADSMDWMHRGSSTWSVSTAPSDTLYTRYGDWVGWLCIILIVFLILADIGRHSRANNRSIS